MSVNAGENEAQERNDENGENDSTIANIYIGSAKELVMHLTDPSDKEICTLWLDFIVLNINSTPVIFDYLKLLLLSLHQSARMPPFNDVPPPIQEIENKRIDVILMGRKMIESYRNFLQERNDMSPDKAGGDMKRDTESVPLVEFGSSPDCKDFFATQRIPIFGRQCYFTTSPSEIPFWWPIEPGIGYPRDYLSKLAWFLYWQENKKMNKLDECEHKKALSSRSWFKEAVKQKKKKDRDTALGFRWHAHSLLPHSRAKLDKKQLQKYFDNIENKGLEVFSIDENAESIKDKSVPESERLALSRTLQDLLDKRSHGTVDPAKTFSDVLKDRRKEKEYNKKGWSTFKEEDEPSGGPESAECFLRKVKENSIKRLLQTSPENINLEEEAKIRRLKELYSKGRRGEEPPPPSPDEVSSHDLLRKGLSWNIPAFKRTYAASECAPCSAKSKKPSPQKQGPYEEFDGEDFGSKVPCEEDSEEFGSPSAALGDIEKHEEELPPQPCTPCKRKSISPRRVQFSPRQKEEMPIQRQPSPCQQRSPCQDRFSMGSGSLGSFGTASRRGSPTKTGDRFSMGGDSLGSFGTASRRGSPTKTGDRFSMSGGSLGSFGAASRRGSPAKTGDRFSMGGGSLGSFGTTSRRGSPSKTCDRFSMGGGSLGSFGAGSKQGSPVCQGGREFSMGAGSIGSFGAGSKQASPCQVGGPALETKRESICFENAEELDFMDQFLMPTADVEFDEEAQDNAAPWGGYDDVDDNWVAPPEIEPEEPYEIGLPPVGLGECRPEEGEEELDRREGRMFMPTERRIYTDEELGPINWPDTEHIHDINVNFPTDDPPFDFLDVGGPSDDFPDRCSDEFGSVRWRDLGLVADQLGFQNFKP